MADLEKTPTANVSVNSPQSGTYGEKADLNRLKQSLPAMGPAPSGDPAAGPGPLPGTPPSLPGRPGRPMNAPEGVPDAIMGPSARPDVPVGTPLDRGAAPPSSAFANARSQREARVTLLQQLQDSPEVSEATREWARLVLETMVDADSPTN